MTKSKSVDEILADSKALRLSFKPSKTIPEPFAKAPSVRPWRYGYFQVLCNPEVTFEDILVNCYLPDGPVGITEAPVGTTVLVHNHPRDRGCFANTNCYVLGYQEKRENAD